MLTKDSVGLVFVLSPEKHAKPVILFFGDFPLQAEGQVNQPHTGQA